MVSLRNAQGQGIRGVAAGISVGASCQTRFVTQKTIVASPLSARYLAALDAYEDVLFLRDLVDRIDQAIAWKHRQSEPVPDTYYLVMGDEAAAMMFRRVWYIEVTWNRAREAEQALSAAVERYKVRFRNATLGRSDLRPVVREAGLPHPDEVQRQAADRRAVQPWWRRREIGFYSPGGGRIHNEAPTGEKFVPLNVPDPSAAIEFWRANLQDVD